MIAFEYTQNRPTFNGSKGLFNIAIDCTESVKPSNKGNCVSDLAFAVLYYLGMLGPSES